MSSDLKTPAAHGAVRKSAPIDRRAALYVWGLLVIPTILVGYLAFKWQARSYSCFSSTVDIISVAIGILFCFLLWRRSTKLRRISKSAKHAALPLVAIQAMVGYQVILNLVLILVFLVLAITGSGLGFGAFFVSVLGVHFSFRPGLYGPINKPRL